MRNFILAIAIAIGFGAISCSKKDQKPEETVQIEEEEFGCLCCPVEEASADSLIEVSPPNY